MVFLCPELGPWCYSLQRLLKRQEISKPLHHFHSLAISPSAYCISHFKAFIRSFTNLMCPFLLFLNPSVYSFPDFKHYLSLSRPHSLLLFLLSSSDPASLSLLPSLSKQQLADGFPITAGTEAQNGCRILMSEPEHWTSAACTAEEACTIGEARSWGYVRMTQMWKKTP